MPFVGSSDVELAADLAGQLRGETVRRGTAADWNCLRLPRPCIRSRGGPDPVPGAAADPHNEPRTGPGAPVPSSPSPNARRTGCREPVSAHCEHELRQDARAGVRRRGRAIRPRCLHGERGGQGQIYPFPVRGHSPANSPTDQLRHVPDRRLGRNRTNRDREDPRSGGW